MRTIIPAFLAITMFCSCNTHTGPSKPISSLELAPSYNIPEQNAINQAVQNCYMALAVEEGEAPDYNALREAFTPDAIFINFRFDTAIIINLDQFVAGFRKAVETGRIKSFREVETFGKTEGFGKIAHRISAYATYLNNPDTVYERGVNSFQLIRLDDGWKINSVTWDVEKEGQPIPDYYK